MRARLLGLMLMLPVAAHAAGGEHELEEATPLDIPATAAPVPAVAMDSSYRYRGYALAEWANLIPDSASLKTRDQSLAEANASGSVSFRNGVQLFGDVTGTYRLRAEAGNVLLNQAGVRYGAGPWELLLGKERARKSPGMVVSPSDFLFPNDSLPGMREQRAGVWMARASWQVPGHSADVIYLHNLAVNEQGMPDDDPIRRGVALRYFRQSSAFDAAANYAAIEGEHAAGGWVQTYILKTTKVYLDAAYRETDRILNQTVHDVTRVLAGASYEGYSDGLFRLEVYANNRGLDGPVAVPPAPASVFALLDTIFYRRGYGIASVQFSDLWKESVLTLNHIRALEYPEWVWMARYEIPLTRHQAIGTTLGRFNKLATIPDATLVTLDWKYNF
jgi:hypothetical protein